MNQDNMVSISKWVQYGKARWLQMNKPEVPGILNKLTPMDERVRKLDKVRDL